MAEKFSTGKQCKRGHFSERLVSSGACCECQREINHSLYLANREKIRARTKAYYLSDLERSKEQRRSYRLKNIEKVREHDRIRGQEPKRKAAALAKLEAWNAANPERNKKRVSDWAKANPEKVCAKGARYRAARTQQMPAWADQPAIDLIYRAAEVIRTTGFDVHVDHDIPLQSKTVSGLHVHTNLQIIAAKANRSKSNHFS